MNEPDSRPHPYVIPSVAEESEMPALDSLQDFEIPRLRSE